MARKKKLDPAPIAPEQQDISTDIQPEPAGAESAPTTDVGPSGQSDAAGIAQDRPKIWTVDELLEEYFPGATKVSGGVLAGLQREMRRRNRKAEKGY